MRMVAPINFCFNCRLLCSNSWEDWGGHIGGAPGQFQRYMPLPAPHPNPPSMPLSCRPSGRLFGLEANEGKRGGGGEQLPAIGAGPMPAVSREKVPTPRVSTTRIRCKITD